MSNPDGNPRGLPASYIIQARKQLRPGASISSIFKRAWKLYKGSKVYEPLTRRVRRKRRGGSESMSNPVRRRRYFPRWRRRRRGAFTLPMAPLIALGAGIAYPVQLGMSGMWADAFYHLSMRYTGYNPATGVWRVDELKQGLFPLIVGFAVHWIAGRVGINRMLGRAKIPVLRI